jgi:hypothetical protein
MVCGKPSGSPKPLGKEWSHCGFCATTLTEIATVQKDSCWTTLFSLCVGLGKPSWRTWCSALGLVAIATWQPIPVQRSRETWGLPCTPSCLSALLKSCLQKINCAIAARTTPSSCCYSPLKHPRPELEPLLQLNCTAAMVEEKCLAFEAFRFQFHIHIYRLLQFKQFT